MKRGFTLIEVIIAISVMATGVLGIYALVPKIVSISGTNLNKFVASQLAREGIEIVRNIRDTNWLEGVDFNGGLTTCSGGCEIDYDDSDFAAYDSGRYLRINSDGFYNYDPVSETNPETKFKRKITITPNADILNVKVEVTWSGKGSPFVLEENLYNWR